VIRLGQALGLTTIAEGVEDIAQFTLLRELGCDQAQDTCSPSGRGPARAARGVGCAWMTRVTRRDLLRISALLGAGGVLSAGGVMTACTSTDPGRQALDAALGPRRRGGVLRIGVTGGSAADTVDPHHPPTYPDQARVSNLYEPLFGRDAAYNIEPVLASRSSRRRRARCGPCGCAPECRSTTASRSTPTT